MTYRILTLSPGSTSTKVAVFEGEKALMRENVRHDPAVLAGFDRAADQLEFRTATVLDALAAAGIALESIDAFSGYCGGMGPTVGGKSKIECQNRSYEAGRILEEAGVTFALITDAPFVPIEDQLLQVILYVKNGMSREMGIRSVTLNAAKITDIDSRAGSIEPGKDAHIVIWDVEPLDTMYQAGIVLIDGKIAYERKAGERNVDYQKL